MPLYDVRCSDECGVQEIFASVNEKNVKCPECGSDAQRLVSPVAAIGAMFSKPIKFGQIGKSFETNAEFRQYKKDNPDAVFVDKSSTYYRNFYDKVRNHCDNKARKQGFSDHEARGKFLKKRKQEKAAANVKN